MKKKKKPESLVSFDRLPFARRTRKCTLKPLLKCAEKDLALIRDHVIRCQRIMEDTYHFVRLFCLVCYRDKVDLPDLSGSNNKFLAYSMRTVCEGLSNSCHSSFKDTFLKERLEEFYLSDFLPLVSGRDPDIHGGTKLLSQSINYMTNTIQTCLSTNIHVHFVSRLKRFVNITAPAYEKDNFDNRTDALKARHVLKHWLFSSDDKREKIDVHECYVGWIDSYYDDIFVNDNYSKSIAYDVVARPFHYLRSTVYMADVIEHYRDDKGKPYRSFQCMSLRTTHIPRYVYIDTKGLMELKVGLNKIPSDYSKDLTVHKKEIWSNCFKMQLKVFRAPKHSFSFILQTDGIAVSLLFEHDHSGKKCVTCTTEQRTDHSNYVNRLNDSQLAELSNKTIVGIDPGKYNLLYMSDGTFTKPTRNCKKRFRTLRYTAWQRKQETKQKHYDRINKQLRCSDPSVAITEQQLATHSCKSVDVVVYKQYIYTQYMNINALETCYHNETFRKNRFRRFTLQQRSDALLLNRIENKFGKPDDIVLAYGDWSPTTSMKHFVPTKGETLRKLLATRFQVVLIDEYRTSKLCSKTDCHNVLTNRCVKTSCGSSSKKVFRCLTCQSCSARLPNTQRSAFLTRDLNSAINIHSLAHEWIHNRNRPIAFKRSVDLSLRNRTGCPIE